jgi:hypothetical protein
MTVFQVAFQPFGIANCMRWRAYIPIGCTLFLRIVLLAQKTTYMYLLGSASFVFLSLFCFAFRVLVFCAADFSLSSPSFTQSPFYENTQFTSPQAWLV